MLARRDFRLLVPVKSLKKKPWKGHVTYTVNKVQHCMAKCFFFFKNGCSFLEGSTLPYRQAWLQIKKPRVLWLVRYPTKDSSVTTIGDKMSWDLRPKLGFFYVLLTSNGGNIAFPPPSPPYNVVPMFELPIENYKHPNYEWRGQGGGARILLFY